MADAGVAAGERCAVFPLNLVLFPGGLLPLRIFEPRYLRMVSECLREQRPFVVAAIVDGPEAGGVATPAATGTLARISDWEQREDGLLGLLCEGRQRAVLEAVQADTDDLLTAAVLPLPTSQERPVPPELAWMARLLGELLARAGAPFDRLARDAPGADHVSARLIELLPLPTADRQRLFDIADGVDRLRRLADLIAPAGARAGDDG